ncbi:MAG TPA: tryptophan synthase subunit alpha [Dehalococcoidia bacterium]|nr:tryptophan synthase subunit alpha [Dehalococcoidia bacterium]
MARRLEQAFLRAAKEGRPALISFVIPGFPNLQDSRRAFDAQVEGGADIIEVEIPFSDPLADGATIQGAVFQALENGTTPASCLDFVREMRQRHPSVPVVVMTYLNPVLAMGLRRFADATAEAGADGVILVDLPPEEAEEAQAALSARALDLIFLVAPTTTDERLRLIASRASGWVYCVSVTGITGAREHLPPDLAEFIARVRRCTTLPLAVGFGISRREHIEALTGVVDGVVIGSAFIDLLARTESKDRARAVREYVEVLSGRRSP